MTLGLGQGLGPVLERRSGVVVEAWLRLCLRLGIEVELGLKVQAGGGTGADVEVGSRKRGWY